MGFVMITLGYAGESVSDHKAGEVWTEPVTGMEFIWIPGGCFNMGSKTGEPCERPVRKVCLDGFWMGKYEVTQGQWNKVMETNPSVFTQCGEDCPVDTVSWNSSQVFIGKLGNNISLPTEAQWEYAARGGNRNNTYAGGNDLDRVAWHLGNSGGGTHKVGTKAPNEFGLYDMSGNVWEWCRDWMGEYPPHDEKNPPGPSTGTYKVLRGGAWYGVPSWLRTTDRSRHEPDYHYILNGFRLVRQ